MNGACHNVGASYSNGLHCLSVRTSVCHTRMSPKLSEIDVWLLGNSNRNSESAVRFAIESTVLPFWVVMGPYGLLSCKVI